VFIFKRKISKIPLGSNKINSSVSMLFQWSVLFVKSGHNYLTINNNYSYTCVRGSFNNEAKW